jgi:hypothetical protein
MTERIKSLLVKVESLDPSRPVEFRAMTGIDDLSRSSGGMVRHEESVDRIFLDPRRLDEYILAHELMHIILRRNGWPEIFSAMPPGYDPFGLRLACAIDNVLDQYVFNPQLECMGFDTKGYYSNYISVLKDWPSENVEGQSMLFNAILIWEALLFGGEYRKKVIEIMQAKQSGVLKLARQLEQKAGQARSLKKPGIRKAAISLLRFIDDYIFEISGETYNMQKRIGISPIFQEEHLGRKSDNFLKLELFEIHLSGQEYLTCCGIYMKSDGGLLTNYIYEGDRLETYDLEELQDQLKSNRLFEFLNLIGLRYGIYP